MDRELLLKFVDGSEAQFVTRELVDTIRHRAVLGMTCVFAILLALPSGGMYSAEVPLWARVALNLVSVALFTVQFPALLRETYSWAKRRGMRVVYEPLITTSAAIMVTLNVEALAVVIVGFSNLTRWDLLMKLVIGILFWEIHMSMILLFIGPALRASEAARSSKDQKRPLTVRIGNINFVPDDLLHIETEDHFLIVQTTGGQNRVLASMTEAQQALEPYGIQVHRRHWVAFRELGEIQQNGRSYVMQTASGHRVAVARERRRAVLKAAEKVLMR